MQASKRHGSPAGISISRTILIAATAIGALSGAAVLDAPGDTRIDGPGVNNSSATQLFKDNAVLPSRWQHELVPATQAQDGRIQELLRIARHELALPLDKAKRRSAKSRDTAGGALLTLGLLYFHGLHLPNDLQRARELFIRARLLGSRPAAITLAWCYLDGCGQTPNIAAFEKILPAVKKESRSRAAYFEFEQARRFEQTGDDLNPAAKKLLKLAAKQRDRFALNEAGLLAIREERLSDAIAAFSDAARKGSQAAKKNAQLAQELLLDQSTAIGLGATDIGKTKTGNRLEASKDLDVLYTRARNLHKRASAIADFARVIELYREASLKGHPQSKTMLSIILSRPSQTGGIDPVWMRQTSLINPQDSGAPVIRVSGRVFELEASPLMDLIPSAFVTDNSAELNFGNE